MKKSIAFAAVGVLGFFAYRSAQASAMVSNPTFNFDPGSSTYAIDGLIDTAETVHPYEPTDYIMYLGDGVITKGDFDTSSLNPPQQVVGSADWWIDTDGNVHAKPGNTEPVYELEYDEEGYWDSNGEYFFWNEGAEDAPIDGVHMTLNELIAAIAEHLKAKEGFVPYVYDDFNAKPWTQSKIGQPTIGYGHLVKEGETFGTLSEAEAYDLLLSDIRKHLQPIVSYVKVPLTLNQWIVMTSFAFNMGVGALRSSTFLKDVNKGDFAAAEKSFKAWNKITVKGEKVESRGLNNRRNAEWALFSEPQPVVYLA